MIISHEKQVKETIVTNPEALKSTMKVIIGSEEGWEDYVMRIIALEEGGYSPKHSHPWPHINFVIEGEGEIFLEGENTSVKSGSFSYLPGNSLHQYRNTGKEMFRFICIVPKEGHK